MKSYVIMIAGCAMLSAFADVIVPCAWKKYMRIITGLVLLTVIISPIRNISGKDLFGDTFYSEEINYTSMNDMVADKLEENIALDAEERIQRQTGAASSVEAELRVNEEGSIEAVEEIRVYTDYEDKNSVKRMMEEVYGAERTVVK